MRVHKVDSELSKSCRVITDTLRPTVLSTLYKLSPIPPIHVRKEVITRIEQYKQLNGPHHLLHGHQEARRWLMSKKISLPLKD